MPEQPSNSNSTTVTVISFPAVPDARLGEMLRVIGLIAEPPIRVFTAVPADVLMFEAMALCNAGDAGIEADAWWATREVLSRRTAAEEGHGDGGAV